MPKQQDFSGLDRPNVDPELLATLPPTRDECFRILQMSIGSVPAQNWYLSDESMPPFVFGSIKGGVCGVFNLSGLQQWFESKGIPYS
jgi:hypothetical protein